MKIKTKLQLGFGFLFLLVISFGTISLYYMNRISVSSGLVLKDNYESLGYARQIRTLLDDYELPLPAQAIVQLKAQLQLEENNVTERGEGAAVSAFSDSFRQLLRPQISLERKRELRRQMQMQLRLIEKLNMQAIVRKNGAARLSIEKASTYIITAASLSFIILFSFSVNFPGFVANPLREFSAAIKAIGRKNYQQRLDLQGGDEFAELATEFNAMVAQLHQWENSNLAKIQSEKLRIEAIIGQMQDAIIGLNAHKEILFLNQVASQLLHLDEKTVIGTNAVELQKKNDLLHTLMQTEISARPIKIFADGKASYFKLERREIMIPASEPGPDRRSAGEVYILKNITEYKELDEAKTNFMATVSHELKTPISSIRMSLQLLEDDRVGKMNTEQQELIGHIKEDCGRLLKMTAELLGLAQVETGNLQLNFVSSEPHKIADYAMDALRFQAGQKAIELELIARHHLPYVYADTEKTAWVLINLLSNALRYSAPKSKVIIQIVQAGGQIEFSVRDFGQGIDEQYQKRLFERYFQVPTDGYHQSGSGLGLAISKDFITAQGGKIWVESEIGAGSRFCFRLPVAARNS